MIPRMIFEMSYEENSLDAIGHVMQPFQNHDIDLISLPESYRISNANVQYQPSGFVYTALIDRS